MIRAFRAAAASIVRGGEPELEPGISEFVQNVFDLDAALEMGFTVTLAEVTPVEFRALLVLREVRAAESNRQRSMADATARLQRQGRGF